MAAAQRLSLCGEPPDHRPEPRQKHPALPEGWRIVILAPRRQRLLQRVIP